MYSSYNFLSHHNTKNILKKKFGGLWFSIYIDYHKYFPRSIRYIWFLSLRSSAFSFQRYQFLQLPSFICRFSYYSAYICFTIFLLVDLFIVSLWAFLFGHLHPTLLQICTIFNILFPRLLPIWNHYYEDHNALGIEAFVPRCNKFLILCYQKFI